MIVPQQQSSITYNPVEPAYPDNLEFPYDVKQLSQAICLSSRRTRVFIRENFTLGVDYDVVGNNYRMMLSIECFAVAVALQYKFSRFSYLIKIKAIPHYLLYRERVEAAIASKNFQKLQRRLIRNYCDKYEQLSFDFASC